MSHISLFKMSKLEKSFLFIKGEREPYYLCSGCATGLNTEKCQAFIRAEKALVSMRERQTFAVPLDKCIMT